jgi:predicted transcriptional regulator
MRREPIIFVVNNVPTDESLSLEDTIRARYVEGYRIMASTSGFETISLVQAIRERGEQIALTIYAQHDQQEDDTRLLNHIHSLFLDSYFVLLTNAPDEMPVFATNSDAAHQSILDSWNPPEYKLYPILDDLLAEWRAMREMPFVRVKGIMTVRAVRIRIDDSIHRAAEVIALSGVGDLMVIDGNNNFVGVLSVGDVLRAAMPDIEEIMEEGGTLEQAFRLFLRKGSELMYKPITPLVIRNPLVVDPEDHVAKVAALMLEKNIHRLPVVQNGHLIGTVGRTDICQAVVGTL